MSDMSGTKVYVPISAKGEVHVGFTYTDKERAEEFARRWKENIMRLEDMEEEDRVELRERVRVVEVEVME